MKYTEPGNPNLLCAGPTDLNVTAKYRVLIVEDDEDLAEITQIYFRK